MKIHIASDHAGFKLKETLITFLGELGYEVKDFGAFEYDEHDDYPDFVVPLAKHVAETQINPPSPKATAGHSTDSKQINTDWETNEHRSGNSEYGIIIGGSGQGEAICANRFSGVRAIVFNGQYEPKDGREVPHEIETARQHNDANVLSLGARFLNEDEAKEAVRKFLETPFSGDERHVRRIGKIKKIGKISNKEALGEHDKDFDSWNILKQKINIRNDRVFFKEGDVWWVNLGCNIGFEMDGKHKEFSRPVVVLKKYNKFSFLSVPLTTSTNFNKYKISVGMVDGINATANLSQLKNIDSKRLINKVGFLEKKILIEIKKKISHLNLD
ncbi:MAG: hypothetical protein COV70_04300 [Parcubacteria group bacterium CG11_big_fil_rev_8_21_14_0_20_39_22]|nr:MAG: hypothetical protein COV70_04300 [Parcubacteria group bacterium CG11_big_fil_rev_8_21_14_0_20_39_22]